MTFDVDGAIQAELQPGEKLLWSGQPAQGVRLRPADALLIPFSLAWAGFAFFWEWSVLNSKAPGIMALWGIPFILLGLYILVGRFFVDSWQRSCTFYALTNERAMIVTGVRRREIKSFPLRTLDSLSLRESRGRYGTITLGPATGRPGMEWLAVPGWPGMSRYMPPAFEFIEDARRVHDLLRSAQRKASGG